MLDPILRQKVDALWDKFWAGGLANPLMAIDQMNYLIFLKQLEDADDANARRSAATGEPHESVFAGTPKLRWSYWKNLSGDQMYNRVRDVVFPWMKALDPSTHGFTSFLQDAAFLIPKASLLVEAVGVIDDLAISDRNVDTQGDIYEHMLGKLGVAGQIGQFRTSRHIVRAMVELADPTIGETVIDPACGTGGFLIAAHQHMVTAGTSPEFLTVDDEGVVTGAVGDRLTSEQWAWLRDASLYGYDFDASMVRIAAMNMALHGMPRPRVAYADALGRASSHAPRASVILANPPFSGTIDENDISDEFPITTGKTELLFTQLFIDLLLPGGRAAVIVPEGVVLSTDRASLEVRQKLVRENTLEGVISLPHFSFKPYASVATFVLLFRKGGSTDNVWMYRVEEDGYSHGETRTPIAANDLPDLLRQWRQRNTDEYVPVEGKHGWVTRAQLEATDLPLAPRVHFASVTTTHDYETKTIGELCDSRKGKTPAMAATDGPFPLVTTAEELRGADASEFEGPAVCVPLVSSTGHGHASIKRVTYVEGPFAAATIVAVLTVLDENELLPKFLYYYLLTHKDEVLLPLMRGAANVSLSLSKIDKVEVPIPQIDEQRAVIAEIDAIDEELFRTRSTVKSLEAKRIDALENFRRQFAPEVDEEDTSSTEADAASVATELNV